MISYRGKYFGFMLIELPVIPRIGENFQVPFAKAALGFDSFVIKDITYTLKGNKQIVDLKLIHPKVKIKTFSFQGAKVKMSVCNRKKF